MNNEEKLLNKVVDKYNEYLLKHRLAIYSSENEYYGGRRAAYSDVISMMTGLSPQEVFEKYSKYTNQELQIKREEHIKFFKGRI